MKDRAQRLRTILRGAAKRLASHAGQDDHPPCAQGAGTTDYTLIDYPSPEKIATEENRLMLAGLPGYLMGAPCGVFGCATHSQDGTGGPSRELHDAVEAVVAGCLPKDIVRGLAWVAAEPEAPESPLALTHLSPPSLAVDVARLPVWSYAALLGGPSLEQLERAGRTFEWMRVDFDLFPCEHCPSASMQDTHWLLSVSQVFGINHFTPEQRRVYEETLLTCGAEPYDGGVMYVNNLCLDQCPAHTDYLYDCRARNNGTGVRTG